MLGVSRYLGPTVAAISFALYALIVPWLYRQPRPQASDEMQVALPRFVQVMMSGGDRYLAANLAGFRALVASTEAMKPENYRIQGMVQSDAAWLNPAHEDNYYIATAILPWNDQVEAAQYILKRATRARPFDWQPPFYYAFNALHFLKDPAQAAAWMRIAGQHTQDELEKLSFQQLAAQWVSKGEDLELAIRLHRSMARETKHKAFANFLEKRAQRLENLLALERAITRYRELVGRTPYRLTELVDRAVLSNIPSDPFGMDYTIDDAGRPQVVLRAPDSTGTANRRAP